MPDYKHGPRVTTGSYIGQRYGRLVVTAVASRDGHKHLRLECRCDCGTAGFVALAGNMRRGSTLSCGCLRRERASERMRASEAVAAARQRRSEQARVNRQQLVGFRFGRLVVVESLGGKRGGCYRCSCDCGQEIRTYQSNLLRGHTRSCGCLRVYRHPERQVGLRKLYYRYTNAAKRRGGILGFSLEQFRGLTSSACHYCGASPGKSMRSRSDHSEYLYNGLDRVDSTKGYTEDNVVPCCAVCNQMKTDMPVGEFLLQIRRIASHLKEH